VVSALIGAGSAFVGLLLSYYFAVATGAAIVLTCTAVFGVIVLINWIRQR